MPIKTFALAALIGIASACFSAAGVPGQVKLDGKPLLRGQLSTEGEALILTAEDGTRHEIDLESISKIDIDTPRLPLMVGRLGSGELPEPWLHTAVGELPHGGGASAKSDKAVIETSSPDRGAAFESFYMAYRPLPEGDAQITARIDRIDSYEDTTRAGLMLRDGTTDEARNVFLALSHREPASFRVWHRIDPVAATADRRGNIRPGKWLRLERAGGRITGYVSEDSGFWREIGSTPDEFEGQVYACLAAQGKKPRRRWSATYQNVDITPLSVTGPIRSMKPKVTLADGSVFHSPIASASAKLFKLGGSNTGRVLPAASVARIEFYRPIAHNRRHLLEGEKSGVLLPGGDFLEAELLSIEDGFLTAISPLFGKRRLDIAAEVDALVLRPGKESPPAARYSLETWAGTHLSGSELSANDGHIILKTKRLREQAIPLEELRRVRQGESE